MLRQYRPLRIKDTKKEDTKISFKYYGNKEGIPHLVTYSARASNRLLSQVRVHTKHIHTLCKRSFVNYKWKEYTAEYIG